MKKNIKVIIIIVSILIICLLIGIIIGKNGSMLKRIGQAARIDMENNFETKVNLKTWVKVKEDWQDDTSIVKKFKLQ